MKKETVTMFNLEAAFKALDEIDTPKASGERFKANRVNLKEYFNTKTAHEVLVEDYFDVNDTDDLNAAKEEREAEVAKAKLARIEKIVDLDAETEEDILPSYVGKMIMQCPQCMTLFYKNEEDIEKSEETPDVVNINEICQHCGNSSGYTLVGKVGGIEESEAENFDLDGIEVDENELNLDFPEEGTEEVDAEGTGEAGEAMEEGEELDLDFDFEEEEEEQEEANESLHGSKLLDKIEDKNDLKTEIESDHLTLNEATNSADNAFKKAFISKLAKDGKDAVAKTLHKFEFKKADTAHVDKKAGVIYYTTEDETAKVIPSTLKSITEDTELMRGDVSNKEPVVDIDIYIDKSGSGAQADKAAPMVKDFVDQHPDARINIYYFRDSLYSEPLAAAKAGKQIIVYTDDDYTTNCPELANFENVTLINVMQEDLAKEEPIEEGLLDKFKTYIPWNKLKDTHELKTVQAKDLKKGDLIIDAGFDEDCPYEDSVFERVSKIANIKYEDGSPAIEIFSGPYGSSIAEPEYDYMVAVPTTMTEDLAKGLNEKADIEDPKVTKILARLNRIADANGIKIGIDNMGSQTELIKQHCSEDECNLLRNVKLTDGTLVNMLEEDLADWYRKKFDRPASLATQQRWEDRLNDDSISDKERKHIEKKFWQQRDWEERHPDKVPPVPTIKPVNSEVEEPAVVGESMHNSKILAKIEDKNKLKTKIESEHLTLTENAEDELFDKLWSQPQPTDAETEANLAAMNDSIVEEDFEELDDAFDEHITEYLKEVYSNIKSYNSTNCAMRGKKLVVEGLIKFQSGKTKTTRFTFDSNKRINNTLVFRGMNEGLTSDRSAFRLACRADNKKLVTENLSYKYTIDGANVTGKTKKH